MKLCGENVIALQKNNGRVEGASSPVQGVKVDGILELSLKCCVGGGQVRRVAGEGSIPGKQILETNYSLVLWF